MRKLLRRLGRTLAGSVHAGRLTSRMDEEMEFHVAMATAKKIREGLAPDEARRTALVEFGARQRFRQETRDAVCVWSLQASLSALWPRLARRG